MSLPTTIDTGTGMQAQTEGETQAPARTSLNDLLIKHLNRDIIDETPTFDYFVIPDSILDVSRESPPTPQEMSGTGRHLLKLPIELIVLIFRHVQMKDRPKFALARKQVAWIELSRDLLKADRDILVADMAAGAFPTTANYSITFKSECFSCDWKGGMYTDEYLKHPCLVGPGNPRTRGALMYHCCNVLVEMFTSIRDDLINDIPLDILRKYGRQFKFFLWWVDYQLHASELEISDEDCCPDKYELPGAETILLHSSS